MLRVHELACLKGDRPLFKGLNAQMAGGQLWQICGPNGVGKTTLLRLLCGLSLPEMGEITWQGQNIRTDREGFHQTLLYIGHSAALNDALNPVENLRFACQVAGDWQQEASGIDEVRCVAALTRVGLGERLDLPCRVLSQGQRRKVSLARLFLAGTRQVWILDEPFNTLDVHAVADLAAALDAHCAAGGLAILTTHQAVQFKTPVQRLDVGDFRC